jgi:hypothetical protein
MEFLSFFKLLVAGTQTPAAVDVRGMRAENLTKFFKFRTFVRSSKLDFKSQILGGRLMENS